MVAPASPSSLDRHDAVLALALSSLSVARQFELVGGVSTPAGQPLDDDDPVILAALGVHRWDDRCAGQRLQRRSGGRTPAPPRGRTPLRTPA